MLFPDVIFPDADCESAQLQRLWSIGQHELDAKVKAAPKCCAWTTFFFTNFDGQVWQAFRLAGAIHHAVRFAHGYHGPAVQWLA